MKLEEELLHSWVKAISTFKNGRYLSELSYNEGLVMFYLYEEYVNERYIIPIGEVYLKTNLLKSAVTRVTNSLCKNGLIEKFKLEGNKKTVYLKLTPSVKTLLDTSQQKVEHMFSEVVNDLGDEETKILIKALTKIYDLNIKLKKDNKGGIENGD